MNTVKLPSREVMLERLLKVSSESHLQQKFYPKLLAEADKDIVAMGVVILLQTAICDYVEGMPRSMGAIMNMYMPQFIDALLIDEEVAKEAKGFFEQAMAS